MAHSFSLNTHVVELLRHRSLINHLVLKELKSRYRGSALGFLWTFLNPLLLLLVYALVFSVYLRIQMDNYAAFMFTGLLPWIWIQSSLADGTNSIVSGGPLVTKVLFPLQVLPTVRILASLANYLLSLPILIAFLLIRHVELTWNLAYFPLVVIAAGLFIWGLTLLLATANVFLRDVQHILGNLLTLWFFLTPILYPMSQVPERFRSLMSLNPLALVMMAFQDVFFFGRPPDLNHLAVLAGLGLVLSAIGIVVFDRYKESFAELV